MGSPLRIVGPTPPAPPARPERAPRARRRRSDAELNGPPESRRKPDTGRAEGEELPDPAVADLRRRGVQRVRNPDTEE